MLNEKEDFENEIIDDEQTYNYYNYTNQPNPLKTKNE